MLWQAVVKHLWDEKTEKEKDIRSRNIWERLDPGWQNRDAPWKLREQFQLSEALTPGASHGVQFRTLDTK
jgi:hypothetical protein